MAGRRAACINNKAVVGVAMAAALLALLFLAGEADETCRVNKGKVVMRCASACSGGGEPAPSADCCDALKNADYGCLCRTYWNQIKNSDYASCAKAIPSKCNANAPKSC